MRLILIFIHLGLSFNLFAQIDVIQIEKPIYQRPQFIGGDIELKKIIQKNLQFPKSAIKDKVYGIVKLGFTVDTAGTIKDIEIIHSVRKDLDNEAIRLLKLLKKWEPAYEDGQKKDAKMTLPFRFYPNK